MESKTVKKHKKNLIEPLDIAIITLSDTRNEEYDLSGKIIKNMLLDNNHKILSYYIIKDEKESLIKKIKECIDKNANIIITNGGTGIGKRDITIDAIEPLFEKKLSGFSSLFTYLSYKEIGSAAILSRATAGTIKNTAIFCIPGSPAAVELALKQLILPEIKHIAKHISETK